MFLIKTKIIKDIKKEANDYYNKDISLIDCIILDSVCFEERGMMPLIKNACKEFSKKHFDKDEAFGEIPNDILNVNGGGVALGHPVGMTGARIIIHLLRELKRQGKNRGLATLCIGGGQGGAVVVEVN